MGAKAAAVKSQAAPLQYQLVMWLSYLYKTLLPVYKVEKISNSNFH